MEPLLKAFAQLQKAVEGLQKRYKAHPGNDAEMHSAAGTVEWLSKHLDTLAPKVAKDAPPTKRL